MCSGHRPATSANDPPTAPPRPGPPRRTAERDSVEPAASSPRDPRRRATDTRPVKPRRRAQASSRCRRRPPLSRPRPGDRARRKRPRADERHGARPLRGAPISRCPRRRLARHQSQAYAHTRTWSGQRKGGPAIGRRSSSIGIASIAGRLAPVGAGWRWSECIKPVVGANMPGPPRRSAASRGRCTSSTRTGSSRRSVPASHT